MASSGPTNLVLRIRKSADCVSLGIDHPGARCTPCKNREDQVMSQRRRKKNKNTGAYQDRHFACWRPWVLKPDMSRGQFSAYELAWTELERYGYPRSLQVDPIGGEPVEVEPVEVAVENVPRQDHFRPPPPVTPSKQHPSTHCPPNAADTSMDISSLLDQNKKVIDSFLIDSMEMRSRLAENSKVIEQNREVIDSFLIDKRKLQQENESLRKLVMEALLQLHQKESVPLPPVVATASPVPIPREIFPAGEDELAPPTVAELAQCLEGNDDGKRATYFRKVYGPHYAKKERDAAAYQRLKKQVTKTKYHGGSPLGKRLYGATAALNPQSSFGNLELTIALSHSALLADAGIELVNYRDLASSVPSASKLSEFVADSATDSKFLAAEEILEEGAKVFLVCDKGALKTANAHFVKILAWYSRKEGRVKSFMLDSEDSDGHSNECADVIRHSLSKFFGDKEKIVAVLNGQATDSGGGGVGKSLYENLEELNLCIPSDGYLMSFCTLHCLQLTLANAILTVLGKGGKKNEKEYCCTALQMLHGVYNLQKHHETPEWKKIWLWAAEKIGKQTSTPKKVPAPILTRWWTVCVSAAFVLENWDILLAICHGVIQKHNTTSALNQIASATQALMKTDVIKCDVQLIHTYNSFFFNRNFEWLQRGDEEIGNTAGFMSRHLPVRYFLMHAELSEAYDMEGWKRMDSFGAYRSSIAELSTEKKRLLQEKKTNLFFMRAISTLEKHFHGCASFCF